MPSSEPGLRSDCVEGGHGLGRPGRRRGDRRSHLGRGRRRRRPASTAGGCGPSGCSATASPRRTAATGSSPGPSGCASFLDGYSRGSSCARTWTTRCCTTRSTGSAPARTGSASSTRRAGRSASTTTAGCSGPSRPGASRRPRPCSTRSSGSSTPSTRSASRPSRPTAPCSARSARAACSGTTPTPTSPTSAGGRSPVDVIRESYEIERRLADMGYRIERYSGAGIKVFVEESDGSVRGLDVFGGFYAHGHLMVMGEIRVPLPESAVFPLGTTTLEGRTLPAPADTDAILTATYGAGWRTPDPAFVYETPRTTYLRFNDWFRGIARQPQGLGPPLPRAASHQPPPQAARAGPLGARAGARRRQGRRRRLRTWRRGPLAGPSRARRPRARLRADGLRVHDRVGRAAAAAGPAVRDAQPPRAAARARLGRPARPRARAPRPDGAARRRRGPGRRAPQPVAPRRDGVPGRTAGSTSSSSPAPPEGDRWVHRQLLHPLDPEVVVRELAERGGSVVERQDSGPDGRGRTTCRMVVTWHS